MSLQLPEEGASPIKWDQLERRTSKLDLSQTIECTSGLISLRLERTKHQIAEAHITLHDLRGSEIGTFSFKGLSFRDAQSVVLDLLDLKAARKGRTTTKSDPFPELSRFAELLELSEGDELPIASDLSANPREALCKAIEIIADQLSKTEWESLFQREVIHPGMIHIGCNSPLLGAYAFARFQEHYESPGLAGRIFSRSEFKHYYQQEGPSGSFTYYMDWGGFNFKDHVVKSFQTVPEWNLNLAEQTVLSLMSDLDSPFYVIATSRISDGEEYLKHEAAHGLWYLDSIYRDEAATVIGTVDTEPLERALEGKHYRKEVFNDECHAYLLDGPDCFESAGIDLKKIGLSDLRPYRAAHHKLKRIFEKRFNEQQIR